MGRRERKQEKTKQKFAQIAIGVVMILLMVLSVAQVAVNNQSNTQIKFNGYTFKISENNDGFLVKTEDGELFVRSIPLEGNTSSLVVQSWLGHYIELSAEPEAVTLFRNAPLLALTFDPKTPAPDIQVIELARFELADELSNVVNGVLENSSLYPALPLVTCEMATPQVPVVQLLLTNQTSVNITLENYCITIESNQVGMLAAKDYLLLQAHGVIPDVSAAE